MKSKYLPLHFSAFAIIILACCFFYYPPLIASYPYGIHSWAQADRLSLAFGFYDHNMNFFLPRTYCLLPKDGITGVEFPIQSYIAAILGKIFGRGAISISFRLLDILISITGMWFLFLIVFKRTGNFIFSILPSVFIFCSPVFIYYTCNYLPDTAGISIVFIGFYYLLNYIDDKKNSSAIKAIIFLVLGTLIKTSCVIYLLSFVCFVFGYKFFTEEKIRLRSFLQISAVTIAGLVVIYAYFKYNNYLNTKYNSYVFLAEAKPFENMGQLQFYLGTQLTSDLGREYFVLPEYILFALIAVFGFIFIRRYAAGKKQILLSVIFFNFSIMMGYLMGVQLIGHEYYAIAIFFPSILFLLIISIISVYKYLSIYPRFLKPVQLILVLCMVTMFVYAHKHTYERLKPEYPDFNPIGKLWMEKDRNILDSLSIPKNENILVLNEVPTNTALLYFDRMGICMHDTWWNKDINAVVNTMKEKNLGILIVKRPIRDTLQKENPQVFSKFEQLAVTDSTTVYRFHE